MSPAVGVWPSLAPSGALSSAAAGKLARAPTRPLARCRAVLGRFPASAIRVRAGRLPSFVCRRGTFLGNTAVYILVYVVLGKGWNRSLPHRLAMGGKCWQREKKTMLRFTTPCVRPSLPYIDESKKKYPDHVKSASPNYHGNQSNGGKGGGLA